VLIPVTFPPGRAKARDDSEADWIRNAYKYDRDHRGRVLRRAGGLRRSGDDDVRLACDEVGNERGEPIELSFSCSYVDDEVLPLDPSQLGESLAEDVVPAAFAEGGAHECDPRWLPRLLRAGGDWQSKRPGQRGQQEAAAVHHSIT
jgi:hypothetical protein